MSYGTLEKLLGIQRNVSIEDAKSEVTELPQIEKPDLYGELVAKTAESFFNFGETCPLNPEITCGAVWVNPTPELKKLFSLDEESEKCRLNITIISGISDDEIIKSAHIIAGTNDVVVDFETLSLNNPDGTYERSVSQRRVERDEEKIGRTETETGSIWENFRQIRDIALGVNEWEFSSICRSCPAQEFSLPRPKV